MLATLQRSYPSARGSAWDVSSDNVLDPGWIVATPGAWGTRYGKLAQAATCTGGAGCNVDFGLRRCRADADCGRTGHCAHLAASATVPGGGGERLCIGHSDSFLDVLYKIMTSGERFVDLTSLKVPDGRYIAAIRNAITVLSKKARPPVVRLLFGSIPRVAKVDAPALVRTWTRDVARGSAIQVFVGGYRSSNIPPSWNHSKIIVADGRIAMSGGHNMFAQSYLGLNPVNDLSMVVRGGAAADAQRFVETQWRFTCRTHNLRSRALGMSRLAGYVGGRFVERCPPSFDAKSHGSRPPVAAGTGATVFSLGRLARIDPKNRTNPADTAILAAIDAARRSVRIIQQDLGPIAVPYLVIPMGKWPLPLFDALGRALKRGVKITLVLSNLNAGAGGLPIWRATYSNGYSAAEVMRRLRDHLARQRGRFPRGKALDDLLCSRLTVATFRYSADETYPDNEPIPLHAKSFLIDDTAFYIGSQNLYEAPLTEHGWMVDSPAAARRYRAEYWDKMWAASRRTVISGPGVTPAQCALRRPPEGKIARLARGVRGFAKAIRKIARPVVEKVKAQVKARVQKAKARVKNVFKRIFKGRKKRWW